MRRLFLVLTVAIFTMPMTAPAETAYEILCAATPGSTSGAAGRGRVAAVLDSVTVLYQERFSSSDGPRCLFQPTCSSFFRQAVRTYGPLWAVLMIVDRMMYRENHASLHLYPPTEQGERHQDPVHRNFIFKPADYLR